MPELDAIVAASGAPLRVPQWFGEAVITYFILGSILIFTALRSEKFATRIGWDLSTKWIRESWTYVMFALLAWPFLRWWDRLLLRGEEEPRNRENR